MQAHPNLPRSSSGIIPMLELRGYEMWDTVCAQPNFYKPFRISDAVKLICKNFGWAERTSQAYTQALLNNIMLTQDQDNPCLRKIRNGLWQLLEVEYN